MTLSAQDIVEQLRSSASRLDYAGDGLGYYTRADAIREREAADTISRLTADNEAMRAAHHKTSHKAVKRFRALWREKQAAEARADALAQEVERLKAALTPSADTKVAYWGEFYMGITLRAGCEDDYRRVQIPWNSIKEIMAAISARAALANEEAGG